MKEYGVARTRCVDLISGEVQEVHRGPMTKEQAEEWVSECEEIGIDPRMFTVVEREVSDWKKL